MSMLTPTGMGGRPRQRPRQRKPGRTLALLLAVSLAGAGGYGAWAQGWLDPIGELAGVPAEVAVAACTPAPAPPTPAPAPAPGSVTVNVFNATGRMGLAAEVATELRARGFVVAQVSNDPLARTVAGTAELRNGIGGAEAARTLAAQVEGATVSPDQRPDASVDLVMGAGFLGLVTPDEALVRLSPPPPPAPLC